MNTAVRECIGVVCVCERLKTSNKWNMSKKWLKR
jgi:hypothetical protein